MKGPISLRAAEGSTRPTEKPSIFRALASIVSSTAGVESLRLQTGSLASIQLMTTRTAPKPERPTTASAVFTHRPSKVIRSTTATGAVSPGDFVRKLRYMLESEMAEETPEGFANQLRFRDRMLYRILSALSTDRYRQTEEQIDAATGTPKGTI